MNYNDFKYVTFDHMCHLTYIILGQMAQFWRFLGGNLSRIYVAYTPTTSLLTISFG